MRSCGIVPQRAIASRDRGHTSDLALTEQVSLPNEADKLGSVRKPVDDRPNLVVQLCPYPNSVFAVSATPSPENELYPRISRAFTTIRGLCIVGIVFYHLWGFSSGYKSMAELLTTFSAGGLKNSIESSFAIASLLGSHGVYLFLTASGFGLTVSWLKRHKGDANFSTIDFFKRRLTRIFPLFWLALLCAVFAWCLDPAWAPYGGGVWRGSWPSTIAGLFASVTTLRNFHPDLFAHINGAWWYVGLSIQLYLVFPLLLRFAKRFSWESLLFASALFTIAYRLAIYLSPLSGGVKSLIFLGAFFPSRLFEFVLGMVLAIALLSPESLRPSLSKRLPVLTNYRYFLLHVGIVFVGLVMHYGFSPDMGIGRAFETLPLSIGLLGLLLQIALLLPKIPLVGAWIRASFNWAGDYSYGTYLTHMNVYAGVWTGFSAFGQNLPLLSMYWVRFFIIGLFCCLVGAGFEWLYRRGAKSLSQKAAA